MRNLIKKEFLINLHPIYLFIPLLAGLLMFIPQWIYTVAFLYYFWISVPNLFGSYNQQRDLIFTQMLPVRRSDIVTSRIGVSLLLQLLHLSLGIVFGILHNVVYGTFNFTMDINPAFFGIVFLIFAGFNLIFFPMYFKTGYRYGKGLLYGSVYTMAIALGADLLNGFVPAVNAVLESPDYGLSQWFILFFGILCYVFANILSIRQSVKHFNELI
jgi:ABC-2 type transport system permease protein